MSKIGDQPIKIEEGTTIIIEGKNVLVKGSKGEMSITLPDGINAVCEDSQIVVTRRTDRFKALHGLTRSLIYNAVKGTNTQWEKKLQVTGTGYKVKMDGQNIVFEVGFSHPVKVEKVEGITFAVNNNILTISGVNKQHVGEIANRIKTIRKPDPYKGKGIRYEGEFIKLKPGKKAKTA
ncbi:50S ribosomal protein L6 [Candidatus Roizmanbacteria bacterium RIFCSPHIGHO2_02_FULL_40_9]|uniref:50S ribosomal protein L6 n=2 Tax=Candidatus Roizmaniibacteriota TaxID=1752723 RepID=A0A1F7IL10_9BACT|nr:MAG: 50S ribosomal protein L6 [Candidatus Roizmanbacteria bacterium RIFCSPHIGHO2_02_FULL_40_9]OGK44020.1 MAG: 50S ribosomal protein L6 [Candidatus Roizmanbacteria bacterium RIFCSPLOWO2_01_FULL_38_11]